MQSKDFDGAWLDKTSHEYDLVKYYLSACLPYQCEILKLDVWKIELLELAYRIERRTANMLKLSAWTNLNGIEGNNTVESVCTKGFSFENTRGHGLVFSSGVIDSADLSEGNDFCFVYSEVAVGRSLVYDGNLSDAKIGKGYDSFYIPRTPLDKNQDGEFSLQEYQAAARFDDRDASEYNHSYLVQDPLQVLPKYLVKFQTGPLTVNKPLESQPRDKYNEEEYIYFDPISASPIKRKDRSQYSDRNVISLDEAFKQAMEESQHRDPIVENKLDWINHQLMTLEEKVREVNLNYAEICDSIAEAAKTATLSLQALTKKKLETLLSMEIELRRQREQLSWLDSNISKQSKLVVEQLSQGDNGRRRSINDYNPELSEVKLNFLKSWKQHTMLRNTVSRAKPTELQDLSSVFADIKIQSDIKIYADPFFAQTKNHAATATADGAPASRFVQLTRDSKDKGVFAAQVKPPISAVLPAQLQSMVDAEMEIIQEAVVKTVQSSAVALPMSITKPILSGEKYAPALHELLRSLEQHDTHGKHGPDAESKAGERNERKEFEGVLLGKMGSGPEFSGTAAQHEAAASPKNEVIHTSHAKVQSSAPAVSSGASVSSMGSTMHSHHRPIPAASKSAQKEKQPQRQQYGPEEDHLNASMTVSQLSKFIAANNMHQFSLRDMALRKRQQLQAKYVTGWDEGIGALLKSKILTTNEQVESVYFSVPFFAKPPNCKLLYSSEQHFRSLDEVFVRSAKHRGASIMLIRSGLFVFGAYLSHQLIPTCAWAGSPSCFLFSVTLNLKLPYHARVAADFGIQEPMAFFVQSDGIYIGDGDLSIDQNLVNGSSELESVYGVGCEPKSSEACCLLAGSPLFRIDELELWAVLN